MKIGLFGKKFSSDNQEYLQLLIKTLESNNIEISVLESYYYMILPYVTFSAKPKLLQNDQILQNEVDVLFSIGGDGTLLSSVGVIQDSNIPVLGVNIGHLGFLTSVNPNNGVENFVSEFIAGNYDIENHSLLHVEMIQNRETTHSFVMNEVYIHRENSCSMLSANVYINGEILATYNGDGLIVSTPTGSTAYSLSCGGPILTPDSNCFLITPIAVHTLTLRPVVVPESSKIRLVPCDKTQQIFVGRDSKMELMSSDREILLYKENFSIKLIRMKNQGFYSAIREKLMWGANGVNK